MPHRASHLSLALALYLLAAPAAAGEPRYPSITLDISTIEVQGDATVTSDDSTAEITDVFTKIEPAIKVALSPEWSVNALFVLQPIRDPGPDDDRVCSRTTVCSAEELHVDYETDRLAVSVGKLTPNFGKAWDTAPGVYGTDFAEGYELAERLGLAAAVTLGNDTLGRHALGASVFFLDTTLNHSLIDKPGNGGSRRRRRRQYRAPHLLRLFPGGRCSTAARPRLPPGLRRSGQGARRRCRRAWLRRQPPRRLRPRGLGSVWHRSSNSFTSPTPTPSTTRSAPSSPPAPRLTYQGWSLSVSGTERITDVPTAGTENDEDSHFTISAGYGFDFGLGVNVGWKHTNAARIESGDLGLPDHLRGQPRPVAGVSAAKATAICAATAALFFNSAALAARLLPAVNSPSLSRR